MSQVLEAHGLTFVVDDPIERWRVETLETKEPGTIQWLEETLRPGDVFYDIGANIGIYTVLAARLVGETGHVYAFEPHIVNAEHLQRNIGASGIGRYTTLLMTPLDERCGLTEFYYRSTRAGSSGHQLGHARGEDGLEFQPVAGPELKYAISLDRLVLRERAVKPAQVVKIDVDGNELRIVRGAREWLQATNSPRSLQIESHPQDRSELVGLLHHWGYVVERVHYTASGQKRIDAGASPDDVVNNTVFVRPDGA